MDPIERFPPLPELVLIIDVGSSAVKAAVVDERGIVGSSTSAPISTTYPVPAGVEQDADEWWSATRAAVCSLPGDLRSRVAVVAVTGQMQDLLCLTAAENDAPRPVRPVMLYSDTRAIAEHEHTRRELGDAWQTAIGSSPDATNVLAKWRWIEANEPEHVDLTRHVLFGAGSEIVRRLTGELCCDHTTAATTGLYDLGARRWWAPAIERIGARVPVLDDGRRHPALPEPAGELGLAPAVDVVLAPGDAVSATIGMLGSRIGVGYASIGTSGWVAATTTEPATGTGLIVLPGSGAGHWIAAGPLLAVGSALEWARLELLGGITVDEFEQLAVDGDAIANGPMAIVDIDGTRTEPMGRAALLGMGRSTRREDIAAALYDGVAHALRRVVASLDALIDATAPFGVCGGVAASDTLCQTIADVLAREVVRSDDTHASLLGAARCAGLDVVVPSGTNRWAPRPVRAAAHRSVAARLDQLEQALVPFYRSMGAEIVLPDGPEPSHTPSP